MQIQPILLSSDADTIMTGITSQLVANLPFIVAIVVFGIIYKIVVKHFKCSNYYGGSLFNTFSNWKNHRPSERDKWDRSWK